MPWLKWLPWRFVIRRAALARGFIDPITVLGWLHRFQEPSEVKEPLELLRAGVVFHARGLLNTKAIQHNLDWVWPYWVRRQFDPADVSFIPRAFSLTHINLTHRNWTAVGFPDFDELPIVDPRGLLMPFWDSWPVDAWVIDEDGNELIPAALNEIHQTLDFSSGLSIVTRAEKGELVLVSRAEVALDEQGPFCRLNLQAKSKKPGSLVVSFRPYNPEGVSFIHKISIEKNTTWKVEDKIVALSEQPDRSLLSDYRKGDVYAVIHQRKNEDPARTRLMECAVGMATGAALYDLQPETQRQIELRIALPKESLVNEKIPPEKTAPILWSEALSGACKISLPDETLVHLYESSLRTLVLLCPFDVYPGPYTYKRFWFRDASLMLAALVNAGLIERAERMLQLFPYRQTYEGYFCSQNGEWDSNGQVLWILNRVLQVAGKKLEKDFVLSVIRGANWIKEKRCFPKGNAPHRGLLPPGFSAEHFGTIDYYYWDNFWSVSGLRAASQLMEQIGENVLSRLYFEEAQSLLDSIEESFAKLRFDPEEDGIPASPYRRMDAGAIGSLVASYPLQLWAPRDPRLLATIETLLRDNFSSGAFFQDMIHSGLNPYLTLHVAQALLRAGDLRFFELVKVVAKLAAQAGTWPEAVHPQTGGGCMGDGHHGWAAAEWMLMLINCFVREEEDRLVLCSGIVKEWLAPGKPLSCGPCQTRFGKLDLVVEPNGAEIAISWNPVWKETPPTVEIALPGMQPVVVSAATNSCRHVAHMDIM